MNSKNLCIAFCLLFLGVTTIQYACAQVQLYPLSQQFDSGEYHANAQNFAVIQGQNGRLYFSNGNGLLEYDGEHWQLYQTPGSRRIRDIVEFKGRIYAGAQNDLGYYEADSKGILHFHSLLPFAETKPGSFSDVFSVAVDQQGVWFSSLKYLFYWDNTKLYWTTISPIFGKLHHFKDQLVFQQAGGLLQTVLFENGKINLKSIESSQILAQKNLLVRDILSLNTGAELIVTSNNGVYLSTPTGLDRLTMPELDDVGIYNAAIGPEGKVFLISLKNGLFVIDQKLQKIHHIDLKSWLEQSIATDIAFDQQGGIWVSGEPAIVRLTQPEQLASFHFDEYKTGFIQSIKTLGGKLSIVSGSIWRFSSEKNQFINLSPSLPNIFDVLKVPNGYLIAATGGIYLTDPEFLNSTKIQNALFTYGLCAGHPGVYYAGHHGGLFRLKQTESGWKTETLEGLSDEIRNCAFDGHELWLGTPHGYIYELNWPDESPLSGIKRYDQTMGFGENNSVPMWISGELYFGTENGLVSTEQIKTGVFKPADWLPEVFGRKGTDVFRLLESKTGDIYARLGNETGVARKIADYHYKWDIKPFSQLPHRSVTAFYENADGSIMVAQNSGEVYRVDPDKIKIPDSFNLQISRIEDPYTGEVISGSITNVKLTKTQSKIRIKYALQSYQDMGVTEYRTWMSGVDENWSPWQVTNYRDYTRLRNGELDFKVQARDIYGRLSEIKELKLTVPWPWYFSLWAIVLYVIGLLTLLWLAAVIGGNYRRKTMLARQQELETEVEQRTYEIQKQAQQIYQQDEARKTFFANVSHEFRTPLTLIIAPLKEISTGFDIDQKTVKHLAQTALRNTGRLLGLVSEILDVQRLEEGRFQLHVAQWDVADQLRRTQERFESLARQHKIKLSGVDLEEPQMLWYDSHQMDRMVTNLLSNALKFTPSGGEVVVSIVHGEKGLGVRVADTGPGLSKHEQQHVFERYYQSPETQNVTSPGTGIGLSLVNDLMKLHEGTIDLVSSPGEGSCFTLWFKEGNQHFEQGVLDYQNFTSESPVILETNFADKDRVLEQSPIKSDQTTLLVVDDNEELRNFLCDRLYGFYQVIQAENGQQALKIAEKELPDLIISDLMMPVMDGMELIKALRQNNELQAIPVILLTARSTKRDTVEGLEAGADDYLVKPFDTSELVARVKALLKLRQRLKLKLQDESVMVQSDVLLQTIVDHISVPSFNVAALADKMHMDRSTLLRKVRNDYGCTPSELIKQKRMEVAYELIQSRSGNVTEIAFAVGFESLSYFSRCFTEHYGVTPSKKISATQV